MITVLRFMVLLIGGLAYLPIRAADRGESLSGVWQFTLDPQRKGLAWAQSNCNDTIHLPGTTDEFRKGSSNSAAEAGRLTRLYPYAGPAWYQRTIYVPAGGSQHVACLRLERTKHSALWLNGSALGTQDSLVAPHVYPLGALAPGKHTLTLCIDNSLRPPVSDPHQISDQTQTDWNGVIGQVELRITDPVSLDDVQVCPSLSNRSLRAQVTIANSTKLPRDGALKIVVQSGSGPFHTTLGKVSRTFTAATNLAAVDIELPLEKSPATWDEFAPNLHRVTVKLTSGEWTSEREVVCGFRELNHRGTQLGINGKTTFLRGRHDACVFPQTGYPPMDRESWLKVLGIAQSYGLNLIRFHTWCPPEAAFAAADELGMYLQPELPNWREFGDPAHDRYLLAEGERLLRAFGNHPSFLMLSLGNELGGKQSLMSPVVRHFKRLDRRHLYAEGSNNWFGGPGEEDDYYCSFQYHWQHIRGSFATVDTPLGTIQTGPANTLWNYSNAIAGLKVPVLSHEVGQYQVAPDFREIPRYQGVVRARNLELFRDRMKSRGLLEEAPRFFEASGALARLCYREEIEAALRTPGFGGFHLLDLMDFPGQGTALVGMLNAFMESKGLITPAEWRQFCSPTVPLLRLPRYTWAQNETFSARVQVAHYGASALATSLKWRVLNAAGKVQATGLRPPCIVPQGSLTDLEDIRLNLSKLAPGAYTLELALGGTEARNQYHFWVYPTSPDVSPSNVQIRLQLDPDTLAVLTNGASVLLLPDPATLTNTLPGAFATDFWNYGMFEKLARERKVPVAPGTLGILCDPAHPAFAGFPTAFHADWQWCNLLLHSRALVLDSLPPSLSPVLTVIDNYERAHRLGTILEARAGKGRILICTIDLLALQRTPEARALLSSLLRYMNSSAFHPAQTLMPKELNQLLN
jgi:hypothetical protein